MGLQSGMQGTLAIDLISLTSILLPTNPEKERDKLKYEIYSQFLYQREKKRMRTYTRNKLATLESLHKRA